MENSVFAKIVRGEIACHKIYEDDLTLAFLDVYPKHDGHALVIPKLRPTEFAWDLDDEMYQAVMQTAKKIAKRQRELLPYPYIHLAIVGTDVPYTHVHTIPFRQISDIRHDQPTDEADHQRLAELAKKLYFE